MDRLPLELIEMIIKELLLDRVRIASYSAVSPNFQAAVERQTFKKLKVYSTEVEDLTRYSRPSYLHQLNYVVRFPLISVSEMNWVEPIEEWKRMNSLFSYSVSTLLRILQDWQNRSPFPRLELHIGIYAPSVTPKRDEENFGGPIRWARNLLSLAPELKNLQHISPINSVTRFNYEFSGKKHHRPVEPDSLAIIASKFPRLNKIDLTVDDSEKRFPVSRTRRRQQFSLQILRIPVEFLEKVTIDFKNPLIRDQRFTTANVTYGRKHNAHLPPIDPLSLGLHKLSQAKNLKHMAIHNYTASASLFWPNEPNSPQPRWPNLQTYFIGLYPINAEGQWLLSPSTSYSPIQIPESELTCRQISWETYLTTRPPQTLQKLAKDEQIYTGMRDHWRFRNELDNDQFEPILLAAVKARSNMPKLHHLYIEVPMNVFIACTQKHDSQSRIVKWLIKPQVFDWTPSSKFINALSEHLLPGETLELSTKK